MIIFCLFIIYLVGVAIVTLFPIVYSDPVEYTDAITWYNFIPFKTVLSAFQKRNNNNRSYADYWKYYLVSAFWYICIDSFPNPAMVEEGVDRIAFSRLN